jgi:predicted RNase H-like HicB family nuclease
MSKPNYRVNVTFDGERKLFLARAPELEHCTAEGTTRAEAIAKLEEEIDAQLANMLSHGMKPPRSVDEETFSGEVSAKISKGLHREIAYQASADCVDVEHLVAELLAAAMESRKQTRGPRGGNRSAQPVDHDNIGNRAHDGNRGQRGFGRGANNALLDDRATFIEYVRGLEQGQQGGHNRGPGGPPHGGHGGHGGSFGDGRRRRRGRGGNPNFRNGPQNDRGYNGGARNGHGPGGAPAGDHNRPNGPSASAASAASAASSAPSAGMTSPPNSSAPTGSSGPDDTGNV